MPNFDDLLTRELERAGRPAAPDQAQVYDQVMRRRARRGVVRRVQAGALTVAVLAATAGGFLALGGLFRGGDTKIPAQGPLNGQIVFVGVADERFQVLVAPLSGSDPRLLVADGLEPAVSPDGTKVALALGGERARALAVVPIAGGKPRAITPNRIGAVDPAWSPDGSLIAYVRFGAEESRVWTIRPDGSQDHALDIRGFTDIVSPTWSPDGDRLAFAASREPDNPLPTWDLFVYERVSGELRNLTMTPGVGETAVAWSPDGSLLAFERHEGDGPDEIWTMTSGGSGATMIATGDPLLRGPTWAPDGTALLASDSNSIVYIDPGSGSLTQLFKGQWPSWQPVPDGAVLPTPTPEPEPAGREIGLGFPVCGVSRTRGDFNADGRIDTAFYATKLSDTGPCDPFDAFNVVAMDLDADGLAEVSYGPLEPCPALCTAFDATDLDGNGTDELVIASYFSIMDYFLFALRPDAGGDLQVEPILVADPGHEPAGVVAGEPLRIDAGGDAGYGSTIRCEGYPSAPVIVWSWSLGIVDSAAPNEVHETRIQLQADGLFHVVGTNDYTVPAGEPIGLDGFTARACGVDWHPSP